MTKKKEPKPRASKYQEKLKTDLSFEELIKLSVNFDPNKNSIQPSFNTGRKNEVNFNPSSLKDNTKLLVEFVKIHIQQNSCENGQWTFAVVGFPNMNIIKKFEKSNLVILHLDLIFIQQVIKILLEDYKFLENTEFKPNELHMMGALLIYCEPKS